MTPQAYREYIEKTKTWRYRRDGEFMADSGTHDEPDEGLESALQGKIQKWAKDNGYPILSLHKSKKAKGFIAPGWPDIVLILKNRAVFIELKSATGSLRKDQKEMRLRFYYLGHEIYQVRSFKAFLEIMETPPV